MAEAFITGSKSTNNDIYSALIRVISYENSIIEVTNESSETIFDNKATNETTDISVGFGIYSISIFDEGKTQCIYNGLIDVDTLKIYKINVKDRTFGIRIDMSLMNSDPVGCVTYTDDAVGLSPLSCDSSTGICEYDDWKYIIDNIIGCRYVNLTSEGEVIPLNSDAITRADNGEEIPNYNNKNLDGNIMVQFKRTWYKYSIDPENDNILYFQLSNYDRSEDGFVSTAFASIDENEVDGDGDRIIKDYMYYGIYGGTITADDNGNKCCLKSFNNSICNNIDYLGVTRTLAKKNGNNYGVEDLARRCYIIGLLMLIAKSISINKIIKIESPKSYTGNPSETLFKPKTVDSIGSADCNKYLGIRNFMNDNIAQFIDGFANVDGSIGIKRYYLLDHNYDDFELYESDITNYDNYSESYCYMGITKFSVIDTDNGIIIPSNGINKSIMPTFSSYYSDDYQTSASNNGKFWICISSGADAIDSTFTMWLSSDEIGCRLIYC